MGTYYTMECDVCGRTSKGNEVVAGWKYLKQSCVCSDECLDKLDDLDLLKYLLNDLMTAKHSDPDLVIATASACELLRLTIGKYGERFK